MKGKLGFLLASILAGGALVGGTFAAWAVTDNADPFDVQITPGTLDIGSDKSVTLTWGTKGLVNIEGLAMGEEKGPYEVGLKATTNDASGFTGSLSVSMSTTSIAATKLIDYLHVNVYADALKSEAAILTVPDGESNYTVARDIAVTSGVEKKVYFFISLDAGIAPLTYNAIKEDVVTLRVDWNKGSDIEEVTAYTYYFNNTDTWANVYAYAWKDSDGSMNAAWPGVKMNQAKGAIYSLAIGAGFDKVVFNNGLENEAERKTADLTLNHETPYWNGSAWAAAPDVSAETEFYLVGTHNEWTTSAEAKLTASEGTIDRDPPAEDFEYTYKIENVAIAAGGQLKVVSSENVWYGEAGSSNETPNIEIGEAGNYDFFFNPTLNGGIHIFCRAHV